MATEVFNNIGESEMHDGPSFGNNRGRYQRDEPFESEDKEEVIKPMSEAKKEYFENLKEDSLTLDTCDKII
jgi:DNA phosphorothioation-dependent restriction protein DptG